MIDDLLDLLKSNKVSKTDVVDFLREKHVKEACTSYCTLQDVNGLPFKLVKMKTAAPPKAGKKVNYRGAMFLIKDTEQKASGNYAVTLKALATDPTMG